MKQLTEGYSIKKENTKITNKRQFVLSEILQKLNKQREGTVYKPITPKTLAMKIAHVKTPDLEIFHYQCEKSKNYSKCFFGRLKV